MILIHIRLGDGEVSFDHFEGRVAEDPLEGVDVAAVPEVVDGEGVAESVDRGFLDAGTFAEGGDAYPEGVTIESSPYLGDKQVVISWGVRTFSCDVLP